MVNTIEIIVSIFFLLLAVVLIYVAKIKPRLRAIKPETEKKNLYANIYGKFKGVLGGKIKIKSGLELVLLLVKIGIPLLIVVSTIYFGILEVPDKVYSTDELLKYNVSRNCQKQGDELFCSGQWKIFIPNDKNIGKLTVVAGSKPLPAMTIEAGPYKVEYSKVVASRAGQICSNAVSGTYHKAIISYYGLSYINSCVAAAVPEGMAPENLYLGSSWPFLLYPIPGFEDPQVYIGWQVLATSGINKERQVYLGGNITLSGKEEVRIKSLNILYPRWG